MSDKPDVHIETIPNHYVGPYASVTIRMRTKDKGDPAIVSLIKRIELDVHSLNYLKRNDNE